MDIHTLSQWLCTNPHPATAYRQKPRTPIPRPSWPAQALSGNESLKVGAGKLLRKDRMMTPRLEVTRLAFTPLNRKHKPWLISKSVPRQYVIFFANLWFL
jgi:hypothetical protein